MSYVDAFYNRDADIVNVVERNEKQARIFQTYPAKHLFYYSDNNGKYTSIFGNKLSKVVCKSWKDFQREQKIHAGHKLFESDINPIFRCLEDNYLGKEEPKLNTAFWDIEVDMQAYAVSSQTMVRIRKKCR